MDRGFNVIHGEGAKLGDEGMKDPIRYTAGKLKKMCPDLNTDVITFFTKIKYHARIKAINEQRLIEKVEDKKRKAAENNQKPKRTKLMRDFVKDGHFNN